MKTCLFILTLLFLGTTGILQAQQPKADRKAQAEEQFRQTLSLIQSNRFQVSIDRVYPQSGMDVSRFNPRGTITITDSVAKGSLPFFGRAYSLPYGEDGGIQFDGPIKERSIKINEKKRKQSITYRFSIAGKNDNYQIFIEVAPGGFCSVGLNSNNRTNISYSGQVIPLKEETDKQ